MTIVSAKGMCGFVNFHKRTTMPIRDMWDDGRIVFAVDIYGRTGKDMCEVPSGSDPLVAAVRRLGLDPDRYQGIIWDAQV